MRKTRQDTLSPPPARDRADGEVALASLLRIGSGLGTRAARDYSHPSVGVRQDLLQALLLAVALLLGMTLLASLL